MHRSPDHDPMLAFVRQADAEIAAAAVNGAILHVNELAPHGRRATWSPLDGAHPLDLLLGFVAPPHWRAVGVSCVGVSRRLDGGGPDLPVTVTVLVERSGAVAAVMRQAGAVTVMSEPPEGVVADACRRALGLPTAPPPPSTAGLWALVWLDRVVDAAGCAPLGSGVRSWAAVAGLHPAAGPLGDRPAAVADPTALAAAASRLARAWPWSRLRTDPSAVGLPGPAPAARLAGWMDDGMWARWLLARLPAPDDLMAAVHALLSPALATGVAVVARAAWDES